MGIAGRNSYWWVNIAGKHVADFHVNADSLAGNVTTSYSPKISLNCHAVFLLRVTEVCGLLPYLG